MQSFPQAGAVLLLAAVVVVIVVVALAAWLVVGHATRLWRAIAPHAPSGGYLGIHLVVGLALSLGALFAFSWLANEVIREREFEQLDARAAAILWLLRSPEGDRIFLGVTLLGEPITWAVITAVVTLALALRREWLLIVAWLVAIAGGGVIDLALKALFRRPRPTGATEFLVGHSWSFPSGHAMGSLVGYGMLAYLLILHVHRTGARIAIAAAALILIVAIGLSRIYLGVHYFTDVAAGYASGVLWLSVCITGVEIVRRRAGGGRWEEGGGRHSEVPPLSP